MNEDEFKTNRSRRRKMKGMEQSLKDVEVRVLAELMKNSRRSDREIAKIVGVSQPTVSRIIGKLESSGVIREYTVIPNFRMLGYAIMGGTSLGIAAKPGIHDPYTEEGLKKIREDALEMERNNPNAFLLAVNGLSKDKNRLFIVFYENYSDYVSAMKTVKQLPFVNVDTMDSFLADLNDESNYRVLSMSAVANHLLQRLKKKERSHE
jgi:DNA-binding Lrp family transcriptional regulator